jgi:hypothetical protein
MHYPIQYFFLEKKSFVCFAGLSSLKTPEDNFLKQLLIGSK